MGTTAPHVRLYYGAAFQATALWSQRWTNIVVAVLYGALVLFFGTTDLDDTFHLTMEIAAPSLVTWSAWRWRKPVLKQSEIGQEVLL